MAAPAWARRDPARGRGVYQLLSCPSGTPADQSRKCGSGLLFAPIKHIASRFGTAVNTN